MQNTSQNFIATLGFLLFAAHAPALAQSTPATDTARVIISSVDGGNGFKAVDRAVYFENSLLKEEVAAPPLELNIPAMVVIPGAEGEEPVQIIYGYSGTSNEGISLAPRSVNQGGSIEIKFGIPDLQVLDRSDAIRKICAITPPRLDQGAIFKKYFTCRKIVTETDPDVAEDLATLTALRGWWDAAYVLSTYPNSFIAVDDDVLSRVYVFRAENNSRFYKLFSEDYLAREIGELLTRDLRDEKFVGIFIKQGRLDDASSLNKRLLRDYDQLPNNLKRIRYYGVDRAKLEANEALIAKLLTREQT